MQSGWVRLFNSICKDHRDEIEVPDPLTVGDLSRGSLAGKLKHDSNFSIIYIYRNHLNPLRDIRPAAPNKKNISQDLSPFPPLSSRKRREALGTSWGSNHHKITLQW